MTRGEVIQIRVSTEEKGKISERALESGMKVSEYVRVLALQGYKVEVRDSVERVVGRHGDGGQTASGPALATDEAKAETRKRVSRSGPSGGITGHQPSPTICKHGFPAHLCKHEDCRRGRK